MRERAVQKTKEGEKEEDQEEEMAEDYLPKHAQYSQVCNADLAPLICNYFIAEFLERDSRNFMYS
jgi:hypothetical protein